MALIAAKFSEFPHLLQAKTNAVLDLAPQEQTVVFAGSLCETFSDRLSRRPAKDTFQFGTTTTNRKKMIAQE